MEDIHRKAWAEFSKRMNWFRYKVDDAAKGPVRAVTDYVYDVAFKQAFLVLPELASRIAKGEVDVNKLVDDRLNARLSWLKRHRSFIAIGVGVLAAGVLGAGFALYSIPVVLWFGAASFIFGAGAASVLWGKR